MRKRFLNLTLALGLVVGLLAGAVGSAGAVTTSNSNVEWLFFPYVPNGEELDGSGDWYGSVTIQNLENYKIRIDFSNTAGGNLATGQATTLEPHASKTFSSANLGLPFGGAGVAVRSSWYFDSNGGVQPGSEICPSREEQAVEVVTRGNTADGTDELFSQGILHVDTVQDAQANGDPLDGGKTYTEGSDYVYVNGGISWSPGGSEPSAGSKYRVTMTIQNCTRAPQIGGVEKQVNVGSSSFLTDTDRSISSVDGYSAIPDEDVAWGPASSFCHDLYDNKCNNTGDYIEGQGNGFAFDGISYLPIVQTNNGWNSILHITNIDASSPDYAAVTVRFYRSGNETVAGDDTYVWNGNINKGSTGIIDIKKDVGIPDEWVGSAEITSDYGLVTNVSRVKNATDMLMTNTAAPSMFATTSVSSVSNQWQMYAPLVFKHYNGWNTGINIVNLSEATNTISLQFHGPDNNVMSGGTVTLAPKATKYIYIPNTGDAGQSDGFHGAGVLVSNSNLPFHAAIDEVKYTGRGNDVGQAMSYLATRAAARWWDGILQGRTPDGNVPSLSLPLVQKGSQSTGKGDTSGIDLFNADAEWSVTANVWFYNPSGTLSTVSVNAPLQVTLGPLNTATIYTMNAGGDVIGLGNMENGFRGSALIRPQLPFLNPNNQVCVEGIDTGTMQDCGLDGGINVNLGIGTLVGVSNNVNYDVKGDGSAVYNLYNSWGQFRYFCAQDSAGADSGCTDWYQQPVGGIDLNNGPA
ncbi:DUF4815 domain-containing protein [Nitrolancea hollandica]|uniref:DUF4815 domain-containing protein n=1 Tax=Nitrolancea hollandica Lb TaxID=1129897 RepID=I4EFB0_9BACT|nr:DUF4815 domain-containing protein [Nitrolancea hollandica]CCF83372.1 conserved exported hypothetical protein [Nitrolancea hollandica Lb]